MTKWVKYQISDVGEVVGGATPSTKDESNYGGDIAWITPKDLSAFEGRYIKRGERNITVKGLNSCSARIMPPNTVLFSSRAPIGYVAIAANDLCTNQGFKSIIPDETKINYLFLYYYLKYKKNEIEGLGSGTTFKEVSGSVLRKHTITIPQNIKEQKVIAAIISSFDDAIEINSRINKILDEMAQSIFQNWFVDFEPFKDGDFQESELGIIPKGWKVEQIGNITKIIRGASPRPIQDFLQTEGMPWVKISDATASTSKYLLRTAEFIKEEGINKSRVVEPETLILSNSATPGMPMIMGIQACVHDGWLIFDNYKDITKEYLYYCLLKERERILSLSNGSVFRNLKTDILKNYKIVLPPFEVIEQISNIFLSIDKQIKSNMSEIMILENIRDTLLTKFMSGQINVPTEEVN